MAHHHHEDDTYTMDQLCMLGFSGTFGVVCLALYFWQTQMLTFMLGPQFHNFVLISGIVLLGLAMIRAATLWIESGAVAHHHHGHGHAHSHDHAPAHVHGEACDHVHGDCGHEHPHTHDHGADEHDHSWAPWRYVVMLVPVMLFLLGLPNKGPSAGAFQGKVDAEVEYSSVAANYASVIGLEAWSRLGKVAFDQGATEAFPVDFKRLHSSASDPAEREYLRGKTVVLKGLVVTNPHDERFFELVRFRIQCCAGDATPLRLLCFSKDKIGEFKRDAWVEVTAKVDYARRGPEVIVRLILPDANKVRTTTPDLNYYVQ